MASAMIATGTAAAAGMAIEVDCGSQPLTGHRANRPIHRPTTNARVLSWMVPGLVRCATPIATALALTQSKRRGVRCCRPRCQTIRPRSGMRPTRRAGHEVPRRGSRNGSRHGTCRRLVLGCPSGYCASQASRGLAAGSGHPSKAIRAATLIRAADFEHAAADGLALDGAEPDLDRVNPRGLGSTQYPHQDPADTYARPGAGPGR